MRSGVYLLIWSKKRFMVYDASIKRYYDRVYLYLGLYVPLLLYKLLAHWLPYSGMDVTTTLWSAGSILSSCVQASRYR